MLTDPQEISIISKARQKNVRDPARSAAHFVNIFHDFLHDAPFQGASLLDLGPGQYDFAVMARERGASSIVNIDNDPAVVELGLYKKFEVRCGQLQELTPEWFDHAFDGLFCKFSINCFWFWDDMRKLQDYVDAISGLLKPSGWSWIAPWNGVPKNADLTATDIKDILETQQAAFRRNGFVVHKLSMASAKRYGVTGAVANNIVFTRNLRQVRP